MIGYRFLLPAEEEMTEASVFYEAATSGLGAGFLDEVQRLVKMLREHPESGQSVDRGLRRVLLHRFCFCLSKRNLHTRSEGARLCADLMVDTFLKLA
jgi:hypothetical protein